MKIKCYVTPVQEIKSELIDKKIKKGKCYIVKNRAEGLVEIVAEADYHGKFSSEDYAREFKKDYHDEDIEAIVCKPFERKNVDWRGKFTIPRESFFMDSDCVIASEMRDYKVVYHVDFMKVYLCYSYNAEEDMITYYGSSIDYMEDADMNTIEIVNQISFRDFLNQREEIVNSADELDRVVRRHRPRVRDKFEEEFDQYEAEKVAEAAAIEMAERRKTKTSSALLKQMASFIRKVSFKKFYSDISQKVIGQDNLKVVLANIYNYIENVVGGRPINNNMILTAPSGCGKTETFRALKAYFADHIPMLPIEQIDISNITEEGYRGKDTKDVVAPLLESKETNGVGLIFLDEFDKKLMPSYNSANINVNQAVQSQLLTLVEGTVFYDKSTHIDTNNTMFIGMGSFDEVRRRKEQKPNSIGFGGDFKKLGYSHFDSISRQEMIELGAIYEFLGRFPIITNYYRLDAKSVNTIINGIIVKLEDCYDVEIKLGKKMREQLHENANSQFGCRLMESMIRETLMKGYINVLMEGTKEKATIRLKEMGVASIVKNKGNKKEEKLTGKKLNEAS